MGHKRNGAKGDEEEEALALLRRAGMKASATLRREERAGLGRRRKAAPTKTKSGPGPSGGLRASECCITKSGPGEPGPYKKPCPYGVRRQEGGVTVCDGQGKKPLL
jgi:hypothetical protein